MTRRPAAAHRAWIAAALSGIALLACGAGQPAVPARTAPPVVHVEPAAAPALPTGWSIIDNPAMGFRVASPRPLAEENDDDPGAHIEQRSFHVALDASSTGGVTRARETGTGPFDMETALDVSLQAITSSGTVTRLEKGTDRGRSTRDVRFTAVLEGIALDFHLRAIAAGPRTILSVIAWHETTADATLAELFVHSFEVK